MQLLHIINLLLQIRYITIKDTNTDPECNDALVCPINYLRANRLLYFNVLTNHTDLKDMDAYKVLFW